MHLQSVMQRVAAGVVSCLRHPHALLLIVVFLALMPSAAQAACGTFNVPDAYTTPSTSPMASSGTITITLGNLCDSFGLNPYPSGSSTYPSHGTVSVDAGAGVITYTNNGDGATSDSFVVDDASANPFTVNVAIAAPTSPITVSPASLSVPHVGTAYSESLSATGGTAPYTFDKTAGTLPSGLTFSGNTISGTPNQAGSYSFTFTVTDDASLTTTKSYSVTVPNPSSGIAIGTLTAATLNSPYSFNLNTVTSGALAPYTYSQPTSGSLPAGISLASDGTLSGTPTATGTSNFTVDVTDASPGPGGPYFKSVPVSLTVQDVPPTAGAASATVAYGSTSNPISLNITGAAATSVAVGTQAAHGTATASGTSITYTPTTGYAGPDSFTYTASNGAGPSSPATVTVTVSPPTIVHSPVAPPNATAGVPYSQSIGGASGGAGPYTYTVFSGTMPAGISLTSNGVLNGTATAQGSFTFQIIATDSSTGTGPFSSAPANVTLAVDAPTIAVAPISLPGGTANTAYSQTVTASGGTAPYSYSTTSTLPTGMSLSNSGVLSGTPTQAGSFPITIEADDSTTGASAPYHGTASYTLTIAGPTITVSPASLPNATVGTPYSQSLSASGGTGPYAFSATGNVPTGLALALDGTLSGTPTTAGDFTFTATAADQQSFTGDENYTLHVAAIAPDAPTIGTASAGDAQATIGFTPPTDTGGAPITGYTATSSPGGFTGTGTSSPITVSGLSNGTAYSFTVTAINSAGPGPASGASNSVTPIGSQAITFANPGSQDFGTNPTLSATSTSGLTVTFTSATPAVCTLSGAVLTTVSAGTCTIDANQAGDAAHLPAPQVEQSFSIVVPGGAVSIVTSSLPAGTGGTPYNQVITASGGATPYAFTVSGGTLPAGMTLAGDGTLSGTPTAGGTFSPTIRVTDAAAQTDEKTLQLVIAAPTISLSPAALPAAKVGAPYSQAITASGGTAPYAFTVKTGTLPAGLSLGADGTLSGTPTAAGTPSVTIQAADHFGFTGTLGYALEVDVATPTLAVSATPADATVGSPVTLTATLSGASNPGGTVEFFDGATSLGSASLTGDTASLPISTLAVGPHSISAQYSGDANNAAAATTSPALVNVVALGSLVIMEQTGGTDATFGFAVAPAGASVTVPTSGGRGQSTPLPLPAGHYTITADDMSGVGFGLTGIACSPGGTGDIASRSVSIDITAGTNIVCTFTSVDSRQATTNLIGSFFAARANLILSNLPDEQRRVDRLNGVVSTGMDNPAAALMGYLPQLANGAATLPTLSTSLAAINAITGNHQSNRFDAWFSSTLGLFTEGDLKGHFGLVSAGADYLVSKDLLVGGFVQADVVPDAKGASGAAMGGSGWLAGPYATARLSDNVYLDVLAGAGTSVNEVSPYGTYTDSVEAFRWMASAALTGQWTAGDISFSPTARVSYFNETSGAYLDSLGVAIPSISTGLGQVSIGPKLAYHFDIGNGVGVTTSLDLAGMLDIKTDGGTTGFDNARGRIGAGLDVALPGGAMLGVSAAYDGIGSAGASTASGTIHLSAPLR